MEVRKKTRDQSQDGLTYDGLRYFVECLSKGKFGVPLDRHHFYGIDNSDPETRSFCCMETAEILQIKGDVVGLTQQRDCEHTELIMVNDATFPVHQSCISISPIPQSAQVFGHF